MSRNLSIASAIVILSGAGAAGFAAGAVDAPPSSAALVQRACVGCHGIEVISAQGRTAQDWSDVVDRMLDHGVDATDAELTQIKAYLAKTYPASAAH